jgi:redox-sensitive bicupin YhaK (pirin superfamily)
MPEDPIMTDVQPIQRAIARTVTTPPPAPGFAGPGHTAVPVVDPARFAEQDPFIVLMDDRVDMPEGVPIGGEHPHAGFEIATFLIEGVVHDQDEGVLGAGDLQWMLAGRGVIHNEHSMPEGRTRILQLWMTIPAGERWSEPHLERVARALARVRRTAGASARVYSGSSGDARAPERSHGHVPTTIVDINLDAGATLEQDLPASYNGFVYVLDGPVRVGAGDGTTLRTGQVGWLDRPESTGPSVLRLAAADGESARVVLYAGEPQHRPIAMHGPFVGETRADLMRVSRDYMDGRFDRVSALMRRDNAGAR